MIMLESALHVVRVMIALDSIHRTSVEEAFN